MFLQKIFFVLIMLLSTVLSAKDIIKIGNSIITDKDIEISNDLIAHFCNTTDKNQQEKVKDDIITLKILHLVKKIYLKEIKLKYIKYVFSDKELSEIQLEWQKRIDESKKQKNAFSNAIQAVKLKKMSIKDAYEKYLQPEHFCSFKFFSTAYNNKNFSTFLNKKPKKFEESLLLEEKFRNKLTNFILKETKTSETDPMAEQSIKVWHLNELKSLGVKFFDKRYTFTLEELLWPTVKIPEQKKK